MSRASAFAFTFALGLAAFASRADVAHADEPLRVAAAADLAVAFREVGAAYEKQAHDKVTFTFGSTGLLEKQLAEGAPFDLFAAANVSYADDAIAAGVCHADGKSLYARGRLVLWWRKDAKLAPPKTLADLGDRRFAKIALANPAHAPYGKAAMQALEKTGALASVKPKLVYGENVQQALQFAQSGNADVALVALALAKLAPDGDFVPVDDALHAPIDQALVVCGKDAARLTRARAFAAYVASPAGRAILRRYGFLLPGEK